MSHTPESLARAFHDAYAHAAAKRYGNQREPEPWDSLSEQSRSLMLEASAGVLGVEVNEAVEPPADAVPIPAREEFEAAAETAPGDGVEERGDWRAEIERQIEGITAPQIRRAFKTVREPFRK